MEISAYGDYLITAFLSFDYYTVGGNDPIQYESLYCICSVIIIFIISAIVEREENSESQ
jgi:hypothetical protein